MDILFLYADNDPTIEYRWIGFPQESKGSTSFSEEASRRENASSLLAAQVPEKQRSQFSISTAEPSKARRDSMSLSTSTPM